MEVSEQAAYTSEEPDAGFTEDHASLERVKEVSRRASVLTRAQLELLYHEGALNREDVSRVVASHPRTVSQQPPQVQVPTLRQLTGSVQSTYTEVIRNLLAQIAQSFTGWDQTLQRLDPIQQSPFRNDDREEVASDLVAAVLLVRNQSLFSLFSEEKAVAIEATASALVHSLLDQQRGQLYGRLKGQWLAAVATDEVPQQVISATLLNRSFGRRRKPQEANPLLELCVADVLVNTSYYYWKLISNGTELQAD